MFPFQSPYGLYENWSHHQNGSVPEQEPNWAWGVTLTDGEDSIVSSSASKVEKKPSTAMEACKSSHKEAERRRRQRINAHLSTLRTLLPNTIKTDKASLLAEVVHHLKELRRQAADVAGRPWSSCSSSSSSREGGPENESWPFPGESNELTLSYCDAEERLVKATICCEDRPGLNRDLSRAISSVRARAVRAEMMTLGGRTKSVVVVERAAGGGDEEMAVLRRALRAVVDNRASGYGLSRIGDGNKRALVGSLVNESDNCDDYEVFCV